MWVGSLCFGCHWLRVEGGGAVPHCCRSGGMHIGPVWFIVSKSWLAQAGTQGVRFWTPGVRIRCLASNPNRPIVCGLAQEIAL
jgi:hypothetical protein